MAEEKKETYEVRCPKCGHIFTYNMDNVKFDSQYPIGYSICPACGEHIQHTLAYVKEE